MWGILGILWIKMNENPPRVSKDLVQGFTFWNRIRNSPRLLKKRPPAFTIEHPSVLRERNLRGMFLLLETLTRKALAVSFLFPARKPSNGNILVLAWDADAGACPARYGITTTILRRNYQYCTKLTKVNKNKSLQLFLTKITLH